MIKIIRPPITRNSVFEKVAIRVDLEGFLLYQQGSWGVIRQSRDKLRVCHHISGNYFHRILVGAKMGEYVDHINGNPLDNRRENLRIVDNRYNCWNTKSHYDSIYSQYKGVSYWSNPAGRKKRWVAQIKAGEVRKKEYFLTETEAALQYNKWAAELHGEYAVTNKINQFEIDLKFGNDSEEYFYLLHKPLLTKTDGRKSDLIINSCGSGIQLKTDRRPDTTGNIFLEIYSHKLKKTAGGPYKAREDGSKYFIYWFRVSNTMYIYDTDDLIAFLEENGGALRYHEVSSVKSNAAGYIVPIAALKHIELKKEGVLK